MEISKQKKRKISIVASLIVIAIIVILIISNTMKQSRVVNNEKLLAKLTIGNIRLLMTEEDFVQIAGQGDARTGCMGCSIYAYYPEWKATVAVSDDISTRYKNKVVKIEVDDKASSLLPLRVGMSLVEASDIIHADGFKLVDVEKQIYALDNIRIRLMVDSDSTIQKIVLSVVDKLPKNITR